MTRVQAGIAVAAVTAAALLIGGGVYYHYSSQTNEIVVEGDSDTHVVPGSPRGVVYLLLQGMQEGDGALIRQAVYTRGADEAHALDALVEYATATKKLAAVAEAAFGPGKLRIPGLPLSRTNLEGQVARLTEIIDDDLADVDFNPTFNPSVFHLKKIDGRWRVMFRDTFSPGSVQEAGPMTDMVEPLSQQAKVCSEVGSEIESGRLARLETAQFTLGSRLSEALRRSRPGLGWGPNLTTMPVGGRR